MELSTDDLGTLTRQLHQLGLRFIGFHRSKPQVQLWRRGSARIIITEVDPETARGTFLRGIGFEVSDASASMDRASLLHAVEVPREQTHNDEVLRGVFAPDGSEVFFHQATGDDPIWVAEFGTGGVEQSSRIDHINLAQPAHHYDEAVLFYTSLLALEAQPSQDVPSPSGLVRSQVMSSADGAVRIPLNVSPAGSAEVTERGANPTGDTYPEHVAIACEDIFAAAATALGRGLEFLEVPENYYEDLESRFALDPQLLDALREHNILYDRDETGEFLHFYTATIGSVFFEMVERRTGYRGYGAPNAPVRLAAQHRRNTGS